MTPRWVGQSLRQAINCSGRPEGPKELSAVRVSARRDRLSLDPGRGASAAGSRLCSIPWARPYPRVCLPRGGPRSRSSAPVSQGMAASHPRGQPTAGGGSEEVAWSLHSPRPPHHTPLQGAHLMPHAVLFLNRGLEQTCVRFPWAHLVTAAVGGPTGSGPFNDRPEGSPSLSRLPRG